MKSKYKGLAVPNCGLKRLSEIYLEDGNCNSKQGECPFPGGCEKCLIHGSNVKIKTEYLNEGGKDVSEFKVEDEVKILAMMDGRDEIGREAIVIDIDIVDGLIEVEFDDGNAWFYNKDKISKIKKKKTKTTKENNMELNSSIRTVFVEEDKAAFDLVEKMQKVFGGEIEENFTGAMILRNNKPEYIAEIKRLDDIEARRLKEEAKKDK